MKLQTFRSTRGTIVRLLPHLAMEVNKELQEATKPEKRKASLFVFGVFVTM
jgi:hypothetical protein